MTLQGTHVDALLAGALDPGGRARYAFTDRHAGNLSHEVGGGDVLAGRARALALVGADPADGVFMEQVHGAGVAVVGTAHRGRGLHGRADAVPGVDALVTFEAGVALNVLVADCVPVLLTDPGQSVAAVHAGREGVRSGIVAAAVDALQPRDRGAVRALIGPGIGGCCYAVPAELRDELASGLPAARARTKDGEPSLDLPAAVRAQLHDSGVSRVDEVGACTRCEPDRWFSHRATGHGPLAGRQAGIVQLLAEAPGRLRGVESAPP